MMKMQECYNRLVTDGTRNIGDENAFVGVCLFPTPQMSQSTQMSSMMLQSYASLGTLPSA